MARTCSLRLCSVCASRCQLTDFLSCLVLRKQYFIRGFKAQETSIITLSKKRTRLLLGAVVSPRFDLHGLQPFHDFREGWGRHLLEFSFLNHVHARPDWWDEGEPQIWNIVLTIELNGRWSLTAELIFFFAFLNDVKRSAIDAVFFLFFFFFFPQFGKCWYITGREFIYQ
jgi:hypothetical protein